MSADVQILGTLYVASTRAKLQLDHDSVRVITEDEQSHRFPLAGIDGIVTFGAAWVSTSLIERLATLGKNITLLDYRGQFRARIVGPTAGNVHLRVAQVKVADDPVAALAIARSIVIGKVQNSRRMVMRRARDARATPAGKPLEAAAAKLADIAAAAAEATTVDALRGHEGDAARVYFSVFRHFVSVPGREFILESRERRPPKGRMNALLSFLYSLLAHEANAALEAAGLDPQIGFLHALRSGKPSLALDLMEELRAPVADRIALRLVNLREIKPEHFTEKPGDVAYLNFDGRRIVLRAWAMRRQELVAHSALEEKIPWGLVVFTQARLLARHLRGDLAEYPPFASPT